MKLYDLALLDHIGEGAIALVAVTSAVALAALIFSIVRFRKHRPDQGRSLLIPMICYVTVMTGIVSGLMGVAGDTARKYGQVHDLSKDGKTLYVIMCAVTVLGGVQFAIGLAQMLINSGTENAGRIKPKIRLIAGFVLLAVSAALTAYFAINK